MTLFEKSRWIWTADGCGEDIYVRFRDSFVSDGKKALMNLSCDTDYTLFINGNFVASGQYGDYEHYKIYDILDITDFLHDGKNDIELLIYHCGVGTSRYRPAKAGVIYEVVSDGEILAFSNEKVLSRVDPAYEHGKKLFVSIQLGFTFSYDATRETDDGYTSSVYVEKNCRFYPRPIKKSMIYNRQPMKNVTACSDTHYLIDLGGEVVGVPTLELISDTEQTVKVAWGEHIDDGGVRAEVGGRSFYYTYKTKKGKNVFTDYMLRLGCRYLEVFSEQPIQLFYAGVLPQVYETEVLPCTIDDELDRRIYDVCVNTLKLCMMEHYVDCPWREQALYAFDSRNQMLCGYFAFDGKNADYARANLLLIGNDRRNDGLLSLCYPCGHDRAIPSFSLYYILAMREYIDYTCDTSLAKELLPKMKFIFDEFFKNRSNGLVMKFSDDMIWNFYDWSPYMEGTLGTAEEAVPDLAINCLFVIALENFKTICDSVGAEFPYNGVADDMRRRIRDHFLCKNGAFTMHIGKEQYTVLGNSLAVLADVVRDQEAATLCSHIADGSFTDCSLSMKVLEYEALLKTDTALYREYVLGEIRKNYKKMLDAGSDTVWETIIGASDFSDAGSLCHGWSAVPVYIFHKLGIAR